eukprot:403356374
MPKNINPRDSKKFKCHYEGCENAYTRVFRLNFHIKTFHRKIKQTFPCLQCGKTFSERGNMRIHMRKHTGFKPFACEFCSMRFFSSGNMKDHQRRHLSDRPFECNHCTKKFYRQYLLTSHAQKFHPQEYKENKYQFIINNRQNISPVQSVAIVTSPQVFPIQNIIDNSLVYQNPQFMYQQNLQREMQNCNQIPNHLNIQPLPTIASCLNLQQSYNSPPVQTIYNQPVNHRIQKIAEESSQFCNCPQSVNLFQNNNQSFIFNQTSQSAQPQNTFQTQPSLSNYVISQIPNQFQTGFQNMTNQSYQCGNNLRTEEHLNQNWNGKFNNVQMNAPRDFIIVSNPKEIYQNQIPIIHSQQSDRQRQVHEFAQNFLIHESHPNPIQHSLGIQNPQFYQNQQQLNKPLNQHDFLRLSNDYLQKQMNSHQFI